METRTLGRTGLIVSALGFGGAEIAQQKCDPAFVKGLLNTAIDGGLRMIDTAECYEVKDGPPSEELLGYALAGRRDEVVLCTKCGHSSGLPYTDWSPELITASIDRSLRRLRTDHVDLIHLHTCSEEVLRRGDAIAAIAAARDAGKTRYIGYSGDSADALYAIDCGVFDTLMTSVSIADQEAISLTIPKAAEHGMGVIAKRPVANGAWLCGDDPPKSMYHFVYWERLQKLAYPFVHTGDAFNIALRFTLSVPGLCTAVVGNADAGQWLENNRNVDQGPLPADFYQQIRDRWNEVSGGAWPGAD